MENKKDIDFNSLELFIGHSVKELIGLIEQSTEVNKKERKILSVLLEYPETSCFVRNYLQLNKQLSRKKESAGLKGLERIAKAIRTSEQDKDSNRISNMFKRM